VIKEAGDIYKDSLDDYEIELPRALTTLEKRGCHIMKGVG
jgi:predicted lipid carrier protein YhbT